MSNKTRFLYGESGKLFFLILIFLLPILYAGCFAVNSQPTRERDQPPETISSKKPIQIRTITTSPSTTPSPHLIKNPKSSSTASGTLTQTKTQEQLQLCSPLAAVSLSDIESYITNPYSPPNIGSDDPHQGIDLSILDPLTGLALAGTPIQAILSGTTVGVIKDRFPYGNAILIESHFDENLETKLNAAIFPTPAPIQEQHTVLTCPLIDSMTETEVTTPLNHPRRSIYVLYAHLKNHVDFQVGDRINCGMEIGRVGDSGNALNPHLHLEIRLGPPGTVISSMAHYDSSATPVEMANYCLWRVSMKFQAVNPVDLFSHDR
jgi:murein DD-endopeptidase MepM/ murein hydrolase activator NlpD